MMDRPQANVNVVARLYLCNKAVITSRLWFRRGVCVCVCWECLGVCCEEEAGGWGGVG